MARPLQEINAGSMADIAFLLLIFFLITTTMDIDRGITRKLPAPIPPNQKPPEIKERNIFIVLINSEDKLFVESTEVPDVRNLCRDVKYFIQNPNNDPNLSEKTEKNIPILGNVKVSKGLVSIKNDRSTSYSKYIEVQNELVKAFNELRDEFAMDYFKVHFEELDAERQNAIRELYPLSISEAEPVNVKEK